jgi:anthranilate phosphoribosyltransferase
MISNRALKVADADESKAHGAGALSNEAPAPPYDIVVLNAGAALYAAGLADRSPRASRWRARRCFRRGTCASCTSSSTRTQRIMRADPVGLAVQPGERA